MMKPVCLLKDAAARWITRWRTRYTHKSGKRKHSSFILKHCAEAQNDLGTDLHIKLVPFIKHYGSGQTICVCEWSYTTYHLNYVCMDNTLLISLFDVSGLKRTKEELLFDALRGIRITYQRLHHPEVYDPPSCPTSTQTSLTSISAIDADAYASAFFLAHGIFHPAVYKQAIRRMQTDGCKRFQRMQRIMEEEFYCDV